MGHDLGMEVESPLWPCSSRHEQAKTELARVNRELKRLKTQSAALEERKSQLIAELEARHMVGSERISLAWIHAGRAVPWSANFLNTDVIRRPRAADVLPDVGCEETAGSRHQRRMKGHVGRERPGGLRLALFLPAHHQHLVAQARSHRIAAHDRSHPPTDPAVCTRKRGLPSTPRASAM